MLFILEVLARFVCVFVREWTKTDVLPPSSWRQATVHRTVAFRWVRFPSTTLSIRKATHQGWLFLLVEPKVNQFWPPNCPRTTFTHSVEIIPFYNYVVVFQYTAIDWTSDWASGWMTWTVCAVLNDLFCSEGIKCTVGLVWSALFCFELFWVVVNWVVLMCTELDELSG